MNRSRTKAAASFRTTPRSGANLLAPDRTGFVLWAPDCTAVSLEIEGQPPLPMRPQPDGYFEAIAQAGAGARYRYRIRSDLAVPDPASRAQAGSVHDPSLVVDPESYSWQHADWQGRPWHEVVLYELHAGIAGGFEAVGAKLAELAQLGVTAIELMPIAAFPGQRNWGYDGVLPYAPAAEYGAPEALKRLIDAAHGLGLMMFLDVVYNHFGPEGNYLGRYAGAFFRTDLTTPWGSAIDFRRPQVRRFFIDNALYWLLEYRFDGLRFDAVHAIRDADFLVELAATIRRSIEAGRHVHLVLENDDNDARLLRSAENPSGFDAQWADDTHHALHVALTGERQGYYADYPEPASALARALAEGFTYQGEISGYRGGRRRGTPSGHLPPSSFVVFLQNHDQIGNRAFGERLADLADPEAIRAATLLLLLAPHIPLIFMGEEWGEMHPFLFFTDHPEPLAMAVREGRRDEFRRFPEFADISARARIPDPNDPATFACSLLTPAGERIARHAAVHADYRHLLALRRAHIVPGIPGCLSLGAAALGETGVRACWRLATGAELVIAANFAPRPLSCTPGRGAILAATSDAAMAADTLAPLSALAWLAPP